MVLAGLWDKLEINWGEVKFGDNAGILSANHKFSEREKEVFNRSLDNVYRDFTAKVAAARNISPEKMDKLARGRVWTGIQAVENGLADEIGGIDRAIAYATGRYSSQKPLRNRLLSESQNAAGKNCRAGRRRSENIG